jgi:nicotinate-nucleotide pyrophosphorylase (carboxylating)
MERQQRLDFAYRRNDKLHVGNPDYLKCLRRFTIEAVEEDVGRTGDITVCSVLKVNNPRKAKIIAKEPGIIAGIEEATWFYDQYGIAVEPLRRDGDGVDEGGVILELQGGEFELLKTERTGLNLLQRMSGIATLINDLVKKNAPLLVAATRKTHWGGLDNKAVSVGGGGTHRLGLWESILIKENHLASLADEGDFDVIEEALNRAWQHKDRSVFIEIEVETIEDAIKAAGHFTILIEKTNEVKPCVVMLDNFSPTDAGKAVELLKQKKTHSQVLIEASGGITPENIHAYRDAGVDVVSMGFITHSPKVLDLSQLILHG